jgi:4-amino-4-deoxy-L-arabinose transferase-like glycosyltransferase
MPPAPPRVRWLVLLLLSTMATIEVASLRHLSVTYDEPRHFLYGQNILHLDSNRFDDSKMPVSALNAIPSEVGSHLPPGPLATALSRLETGRYVTVAFSLAVGWCIFAWARARAGDGAGLVALVLYAFDPNMLAHGQLVTTDVYAAGSIAIALFAFWRLLDVGGWWWTVATGLALGLALLAKYTALALLPLLVSIALVVKGAGPWRLLRAGQTRLAWRTLASACTRAIVIGALALGAVNAGFLFNRTGTPLADYALRSRPFQSFQRRHPVLSRAPIPLPYPYVEGLDWVIQRERTGEGYGNIYLLGETRKGQGFAGYYFVATLFKLPLGTLALLAAAAASYVARIRRREVSKLDLVILIPVAFFTIYFNFFYRAQIGIRYFLVVFPLLYILAGDLVRAGQIRSRRANLGLAAALVATIVSVASYYPHFLPYFNELIGKRTNAYRILADSNLDWRQHVWYFDQYMASHPGAIVEPERPTAGTILVGVNMLTGVAGDPERFRWLREHFTPVGHIAHAVLIYEVSDAQLQALESRRHQGSRLQTPDSGLRTPGSG